MKKAAALALGAILLVGAPAMAQDKIEMGAAWIDKSGSTNRLFNAMKERLAKIAPNISIETVGELPSVEELDKTFKRFEAEKKGSVIMRDSGAIYLSKNPPSKPVFGAGWNHPVYHGVAKSLDKPGGNITGVSYYLDMNTVLQSFMAIAPDAKTFDLITEKGHPGSRIDEEETRKACEKQKLSCTFTTAQNAEEAVSHVKAGAGKVDAFILGNQAKLIDNSATIVEAAGKTPVFALSDISVRKGKAVAGFVADLDKLGQALADTIVDVMVKGKSPAETPFKLDNNPLLTINMGKVTQLGLDVPLDLLSAASTVE